MSLLFFDGAAFYDTGTGSQRATLAGTPTVQATSGPFNSVSANGRWLCNGASDNIRFVTNNTDATFIAQFYLERDILHLLTESNSIRFRNNDDSVDHLYLYFFADNSIELRRGTGTVLFRTGRVYSGSSNWNYVECKMTINDTTGSFVMRVNGREVINVSSVDTKNGGTGNYADSLVVLNNGNGSHYVANVLLMNGAGSAPYNDFIGQRRVYTLFPNAGDTSNWTRSSTASTNWQLVDDSAPDGDTTYVESASTGTIDMYGFTNLSTSASSVDAIAVNISARDSSTSPGNMRARIDSTGSVATGTAFTLSTDYTIYQTIFTDNPASTAGWTTGNINTLLAGIEVTA